MKNARVIAFDVRPRRLGYVVLEGPTRLIDWGVKRFDRDTRHVESVARLVALYRPSVIVLRRTKKGSSRHTPRLRKVYRHIVTWTKSVGLPTTYLTSEAMRRTFRGYTKPTKERIARLIAGCYPELAWRLPPPRKVWETESRRMPIFDAGALGLAYFAMNDPAAVQELLAASASSRRPLGGVAR